MGRQPADDRRAMRRLGLKPGQAKPLWHGHPWVFASSVAVLDPPAREDDDVARVADEDGRTIGHAFVSEGSAIRARLLVHGAEAPDVEALLQQRIAAAVAWRRRLFPASARTTTHRLVHGEGDRLPGLVVDRHGDVLVAQFATASMARRRERLAAWLLAASGARGLLARPGGYEREEGIDPDAARFEVGEIPAQVAVEEAGMALLVDPREGQKTGHYCDQRENRLRVGSLCANGTVLDLYAGTGGFGVQALRHGARHVVAVESAARSLARAAEHAAMAGAADRWEGREGDVRDHLAALRDAGTTFDVVVVDPPNFFPRRGDDRFAHKGHRELNVRALGRVSPAGGLLATFSCSSRLDAEGLRASLASAARDCRRTFRLVARLEAGLDHPIAADGEVGRYLAGWIAAVDPLESGAE